MDKKRRLVDSLNPHKIGTNVFKATVLIGALAGAGGFYGAFENANKDFCVAAEAERLSHEKTCKENHLFVLKDPNAEALFEQEELMINSAFGTVGGGLGGLVLGGLAGASLGRKTEEKIEELQSGK